MTDAILEVGPWHPTVLWRGQDHQIRRDLSLIPAQNASWQWRDALQSNPIQSIHPLLSGWHCPDLPRTTHAGTSLFHPSDLEVVRRRNPNNYRLLRQRCGVDRHNTQSAQASTISERLTNVDLDPRTVWCR